MWRAAALADPTLIWKSLALGAVDINGPCKQAGTHCICSPDGSNKGVLMFVDGPIGAAAAGGNCRCHVGYHTLLECI